MIILRLVVSVILAISCLLTFIVTYPSAIILLGTIAFFRFYFKAKAKDCIPDHVVVTGGSSGIGLCIAKECIKRGVPKVTILARNTRRLEHAMATLENFKALRGTNTSIRAVSLSVSDKSALRRAARRICREKDYLVLFNCAGICYTTFLDEKDSLKCMELVLRKQLGAMYACRTFVKHMRSGCLVLPSSCANQSAVCHYTKNSPADISIRG